MRPAGIIFDFDGVLIESEFAGNAQIADFLSARGHPTTVRQSMEQFMGLAGDAFRSAIERWIGGPLPQDFERERAAADAAMMASGLEAVAGAVAFVRSLDAALPKAIASSSSPQWIDRHLVHIGLGDAFGRHRYSGRVDVARGKPAPDLYLHAAAMLGVRIEQVAIIEDSPVGVTGAVASGATVIGLAAGRHCFDGHGERLRALGAHHIAHSFDEVAALLG